MDKDLCKRFSEIRGKTDLNKQQFADSLDIPSTTVSDIELGKREPSKDVLLKLKSKFGINLHWMLTGEGQRYLFEQEKSLENASKSGFKRVPVYSETELPEGAFIVPLMEQRLSAGSGSYLSEEDAVTALVHVPAYLSRYGDKIAALTVDGDSMYPTLRRGDMVICDSCGWSGEGVYALRMNGEGFVKRLTQKPGKIVVISDNPKYESYEEPEGDQGFDIIGRVHCAITKME
jgi:phage repressor protein C with HTH and peptisase S24 domain